MSDELVSDRLRMEPSQVESKARWSGLLGENVQCSRRNIVGVCQIEAGWRCGLLAGLKGCRITCSALVSVRDDLMI
jgi:hypothetical protein